MKAIQYTIRNVPDPVDRYLRKRAKISGRSLNDVVIEELSERAGIGKENLADSLAWFIGGGMDDEVLRALERDDKEQKALARREMSGEREK